MMDAMTGSASSPQIQGIPVFEVVGSVCSAGSSCDDFEVPLGSAWLCQVAQPLPRHVGVQRFMLHTVLHE